MHLFWSRSTKFLLVLLAITVAIVGVLATLVVHQQHRTATHGTRRQRSCWRRHHRHSERGTLPQPSATPASPVPQAAPAPQLAATPITPALVASVPQIITPPQLAPSPQTPLKRKTVLHRRVNSVPAPPPAAAAHPATPAPQTDTLAKPGAPDGW